LKQRLIQTVAPNTRLKILNELKRSQCGLPAGEIAERLKMSYMGIKELCDEMERGGLLGTWRQPQQRGRPFKLYRLTEKAHELFPSTSNSATLEILEAAQKLFGPTAPEKLLLVYFHKLAASYEQRLRSGPLAERAKWFARLRDHDGYMSEFETMPGGGFAIIEHHSPLLDLLRAFPIVAKLETDLFQRILDTAVRREETQLSGLFTATFFLG
jgi:predicted ArsR family transcriptional regulator